MSGREGHVKKQKKIKKPLPKSGPLGGAIALPLMGQVGLPPLTRVQCGKAGRRNTLLRALARNKAPSGHTGGQRDGREKKSDPDIDFHELGVFPPIGEV